MSMAQKKKGDRVEGNEAFAKWGAELKIYFEGQPGVEALRAQDMPNHPWPAFDNTMVAYLADRAKELLSKEGPEAAIYWAITHAWFEGAIEAHAVMAQP